MTPSDLDTATLIRRLTEDLEAGKAKTAALEQELTKTTGSTNYWLDRCASAERRAGEYQRALSGLRSELDAKKAEIERLRDQLRSALAQARANLDHVDTKEAEIARLTKEVETRARSANEALASADDYIKKWRDAERERDEARRERDDCRNVRAAFQQFCADSAELIRGRSDELRKRAEKAEGERDDLRSSYAHVVKSRDELSDERDRLRRQRDEAREQLAKVEWFGMECLLCEGMEPRPGLSVPPFGHKPDCWFAKQKTAGVIIWPNEEPSLKIGTTCPEPKFKVGQKVQWQSDETSTATGHVEEIGHNNQCLVRGSDGKFYSMKEASLTPAPKFAVGEWVTWLGDSSGVVGAPKYFLDGLWWYRIMSDNATIHCMPEPHLTAQTPQHNRETGGTFLGRHGDADLYFCSGCPNGTPMVFVITHGMTSGYCADVPHHDALVNEAHRRAKARGLL